MGVGWVDFVENIDHENFYTTRFVITIFYTTTVFQSF